MAPPLAVANRQRSARSLGRGDSGCHGLPAPVLVQCGLVLADGAPPPGGAERTVDSASAFRTNHAVTDRTVAQHFGDL